MEKMNSSQGTVIGETSRIGDHVKIQNGALIYHGTTIENGAFIGPGAIFTNDKRPRSINRDGTLKRDSDWHMGAIRVCHGASVGAGAIILPDVTIGAFAMVGAGAIVTKDVPPHALVTGNPARHAGYSCRPHHAGDPAGACRRGVQPALPARWRIPLWRAVPLGCRRRGPRRANTGLERLKLKLEKIKWFVNRAKATLLDRP